MRFFADPVWLIVAILLGMGSGCFDYVDHSGDSHTVEGACLFEAPADEIGSWAIQEQGGYWLNCYRNLAGLPPAPLGTDVSVAASRHAAYMDETQEFGFLEEDVAAANYSGYDVLDRLDATGFELDLASHYLDDIITYAGEDRTAAPRDAIDAWIDTVYHRSPLLRPAVDIVGIGASGPYVDLVTAGPWDSLAAGGAGDVTAAAYPADGQTGVPVSFATDSEQPDPVADRNLVGYPISVTFHGELWHDNGNHFDVRLDPDGCSVQSRDGDQVPLLYREPDTDPHLHDSVFLIPMSPLQAGQTYDVRLTASVHGQPWASAWSFTTSP